MSSTLSELAREKVSALEAVARAWNHSGVEYAIANGLEGYPKDVGRDLDLIVHRRQLAVALAIAEDTLRAEGFSVVYPSEIWGQRIVGAKKGANNLMIEIHALTALTWRNIVLAPSPHPTDAVGPFRVDPWIAFAKRVVLPLLSSDVHKFADNGERLIPREGEDGAEQRLHGLFGGRLAASLWAAVRNADLLAVERLAPMLRSAGVARAWVRDPIASASLTTRSIRNRLLQPVSPCAPVVALVGPDGSGKSTLTRELSRVENLVFLDTVVRHWRPGVLPQLGALIGRPTSVDPDEPVAPRRTPGKLQWLRLAYYSLDLFLGTYFKDRVESSRQKLIVYDRCFLDMAVDPVRYGLSSDKGVLRAWRALPKPDLIILLEDDPERIHARKAELPVEEIASQLGEWHSLATDGHVQAVVQVDAPPAEVARRVMSLVIDAFLAINGPADGTRPKEEADVGGETVSR